ncbi:hypothetical protein RFI_32319 [Reticulomyxa filosa]|uniref:Uncharacterized protein n=1 Tax=Reticulomyxa filosa TaxID=46433 RepID=X6LVA7_RETFI|nr:hypothetical protein RFI_32319 [Reticulomyxa filosa]|eukprot:ETO05077.1 hypothetical protein RFI_32319 [Reticulomyxa filosa]
MNEKVYVVKNFDNDSDPAVRFDEDGVMWVRGETTYSKKQLEAKKKRGKYQRVTIEVTEDNKDERKVLEWIPVRAAFRYVTQTPWSRFPIATKTRILNPVLCCLAGGRNKNVAAKAYDMLNSELRVTMDSLMFKSARLKQSKMFPKMKCLCGLKNLAALVSLSDMNVTYLEIDLMNSKKKVVKNPYSNAGQGVYTITNKKELESFMKTEATYEKFIVQSLVGNYTWSSLTSEGRLFHVGTVPDKHCNTYAVDIRMMVHYSKDDGWLPVALYSRRARVPLVKDLQHATHSSWDMLGTNLSEKMSQNVWNTDTARLLIMDRKDFNKLGIGIDDLIDGFVQTVLAIIAIDKMADKLIDSKGNFDFKMFASLNDDKCLAAEILNKAKCGYPADWIKSSPKLTNKQTNPKPK